MKLCTLFFIRRRSPECVSGLRSLYMSWKHLTLQTVFPYVGHVSHRKCHSYAVKTTVKCDLHIWKSFGFSSVSVCPLYVFWMQITKLTLQVIFCAKTLQQFVILTNKQQRLTRLISSSHEVLSSFEPTLIPRPHSSSGKSNLSTSPNNSMQFFVFVERQRSAC